METLIRSIIFESILVDNASMSASEILKRLREKSKDFSGVSKKLVCKILNKEMYEGKVFFDQRKGGYRLKAKEPSTYEDIETARDQYRELIRQHKQEKEGNPLCTFEINGEKYGIFRIVE